MASGSIFLKLEGVQNSEHFNTSTNNSMSSSVECTAKSKRLTNSKKREIVHGLSLNYNNNKLKRGSINILATYMELAG